MDSYHHAPTSFACGRHNPTVNLNQDKPANISARRPGWFFWKSLAATLAAISFGFTAEVSSQPIKLGYAALSAGQIAAWMAKEGGYLSKYGIEAELIYIPAIAATQALIAGEIQLAQ